MQATKKLIFKITHLYSNQMRLMLQCKQGVNNSYTSLAAPGALAHSQQRLQNPKWPPGVPKMAVDRPNADRLESRTLVPICFFGPFLLSNALKNYINHEGFLDPEIAAFT